MGDINQITAVRARKSAEERALEASLKKLDARRRDRRETTTRARDSIARESAILASIARLDDALKRTNDADRALDVTSAFVVMDVNVPLAPKRRAIRVLCERPYRDFCRSLADAQRVVT